MYDTTEGVTRWVGMKVSIRPRRKFEKTESIEQVRDKLSSEAENTEGRNEERKWGGITWCGRRHQGNRSNFGAKGNGECPCSCSQPPRA